MRWCFRVLFSLLLLILLFAPLGPTAAHAQDDDRSATGRITGRVLAADTGAPLQGATVSVRLPADSSLVTGVATDSSGAFTLRGLALRTYDVRIGFVGFSATRLTDVRLTRSRPERNLGDVKLRQETAQLEEVTVSAERPAVEIKTDRTVYNTDRQVVAAGGSARTVLNTLPSIQVDLDGSISFRGSEGIVVQINGEPTSLSGQPLANFLESLPATAVERVEVIPNPSAKEEPEGSAGILNIVLKRNRSGGWSGGVTAGLGTNRRYTASGNVGYQTGPWRLFGNYGFRGGTEDEGGSRFRRNFTATPTTLLNQSTTETEVERSHTLNTQVEYRPSKATTVSLETVLSAETEGRDERTNFLRRVEDGALLDRYARLNDGDSNERNLDARLTARQRFGDDHDLRVQLRYEHEREDEVGTYTERALSASQALGSVQDRERDLFEETEGEGSLEIDYTRPLGTIRIETGYQGELRTQRSDQVFEVFAAQQEAYRPEESTLFDYNDRTHALYGQASLPLGQWFDVKAGLRAEHTFRTFTLAAVDDNFDKTYTSLFPSAFLTYNRNDAYLARLSYSKRIRRPGTWQLDPIDDNDDPNFRFRGNPQLDPEYIHSFEFSFTRQWAPASVSVTPFFRHTVDEIERREDLRPNGVTVLTFDNFATSNSYGLELVTSLEIQNWVRGNVSVNANRIVTDASNVSSDLSNNAMAYSARANLTFPVGMGTGVDLQVSQYYSAPRTIAGGEIGGRTSTDLALRKELFNEKASLNVRVSHLFDAQNFELERRTGSFYTESERQWSQRRVMVNVTYAFGGSGGGNRRGGRR